MKENFEACLAATLSHEGGWADHPADPGGATMKGITLATYRQYRPSATKAGLRAITDAEVRTIYRRGYWDAVKGDDLPKGLDLVTFDPAVNSGPARGAKWLQQALRVARDGVVGPKTLAAARTAEPVDTIKRACAARMGFLRGLGHWSTFGTGWSRRVASIEAQSVHMARPGAVAGERGSANNSAAAQATGAVGSGGGGFALPAMGDWPLSAQITVAIVAAFVIVVLLARAKHDRNRAAAYQAIQQGK